ncbi:MAG: imelysin family protein, partial [Polyangiales bacterium]
MTSHSTPTPRRPWRSGAFSLCAGLLLLGACSDDDNSGTGGSGSVPDSASEIIGALAAAPAGQAGYADLVFANYEDALADVQALKTAIDAFVAAPSAATQDAAKTAWLVSRERWGQTEAYRFYDGPIDNPVTGVEGFVNAWPLDECYVDTCEGSPDSGIINDVNVAISPSALEGLNEVGGEANIATGFHAIEFLLWGQDFNDAGPGQRSYTDYLDAPDNTAPNPERRRQYLVATAELLVSHIQQLVDAWRPDIGSYRSEFVNLPPEQAVTNILTGIAVLSGFETGGERLRTALDTGDQEDEHSCFSDNTHRDMVMNTVGVQNVCEGRYTRTDGSTLQGRGICDLIAEADSELAASLRAQVAESVDLAEALPIPFDQAIAPGNPGNAAVQALID